MEGRLCSTELAYGGAGLLKRGGGTEGSAQRSSEAGRTSPGPRQQRRVSLSVSAEEERPDHAPALQVSLRARERACACDARGGGGGAACARWCALACSRATAWSSSCTSSAWSAASRGGRRAEAGERGAPGGGAEECQRGAPPL
eukprot:1266013-Rhodomonas_salina.1